MSSSQLEEIYQVQNCSAISMQLINFLGIFFYKSKMFSSASYIAMIAVIIKPIFSQICQIRDFKLDFCFAFFVKDDHTSAADIHFFYFSAH